MARLPTIPGMPGMVGRRENWGNFKCHKWGELLRHLYRPSNAVEIVRRMIWWFYGRLREYKLTPIPEQASLLRAQFDCIFERRTGYATLDRLLKLLLGRKDELLRVLERPEIPLNTNASENDIRAFVTKRKISGGTVSEKVRQDRDVMLGLAKICMKLKILLSDYLGARLAIQSPGVPQPRDPRQPRAKLEQVPIDWNRRCPMKRLRAPRRCISCKRSKKTAKNCKNIKPSCEKLQSSTKNFTA